MVRHVRGRHGGAAICAIALVMVARGAHAEWSLALQSEAGADGCLEEEALRADVRERLGAEAAQNQPGNAIALHLERDAGDVVLAIELRDANGVLLGERELRASEAECATLRAAAVLAITVMLGSDAQRAPPAASRAAPSAPPQEEPVPVSRSLPDRAAQLELFGAAQLSAGLVPGAGLHAVAGLRSTALGGLPLELAVTFLGSAAAGLGQSSGTAQFAPLYALLAACPFGVRDHALRASACLGAQAGVLFVQAHAFTDKNESSTEPLIGVVARAPAALRVAGPLWLSGAITGGTPLLYRHVAGARADGTQRDLWHTSPIFGSVELGLGLELL